MTTKIGSNSTTNPFWAEEKVMKGEKFTPEEVKTAEIQNEAMQKTIDTLKQTVKKGDMGSARARVNTLADHFKSLGPAEKEFMYNLLQSDLGLADLFDYKLSNASKESLLKILNPDHVSPQKFSSQQAEKAKASKTGEMNLGGLARQQELVGTLKLPLE